jgi:ubiquinone/menaquinone biosynthesis C-methylase UbiE
MIKDFESEINIEDFRKIFLKFTREAFQMLPKMANMKILDIGCGSGTPSMELIKLFDGTVVGIDIDQDALNKFNLKIKRERYSNRISTLHCSIYETHFQDNSFNILWEEGVLHLLNLKKALKECNRLLTVNGFLVMNETIKWFDKNNEVFLEYDFKLNEKFLLPERFWWTDYYEPLEKKIKQLRYKYKNKINSNLFKKYEREIKMVKKNPTEFDCGFYIMKKIN